MRIREVHLQNFGQHVDLKIDFDAPVTGMFGPNGAGKSTVLSAIRFAWTGILDDPAQTYVHNFSEVPVPGAPSNGSVKLVFMKGGKEGVIFRQVGKSPRQYMEWGENVGKKALKTAKEIEATIAGILSADKQALDNAVFISQGDMQDLLFGDDSQREKLYARMLLVSFCENVHRKLQDKANSLGAGLQDLTATRDEAVGALSAARKELHTLVQAVAALPDLDAESLELFETWSRRVLRIKTATDARLGAQQTFAGSERTRADALRQLLHATGAPDVPAAETSISELANKVAKAESSAALLAAAETGVRNLDQADREAATATEELQLANRALEELTAALKRREEVVQIQTRVEASRAAQRDLVELERLTGSAETNAKVLQRFEAEHPAKAEAARAAEAELGAAEKAAAGPRMTVTLLNSVKGLKTDCCPICRSKISEATFSPEAVLEEQGRLRQAEVVVEAAKKKVTAARAELSALEKEIAAKRSAADRDADGAKQLLHRCGVATAEQLRARLLSPEQMAEDENVLRVQAELVPQKPLKESMVTRAQDRQNRAAKAQLSAAMQLHTARQAAAGLQPVDLVQLAQERARVTVLTKNLHDFKACDTEYGVAKTQLDQVEKNLELAVREATEASAAIQGRVLLSDLLGRVSHDVITQAGHEEYIRQCRTSVGDYRKRVTEATARRDQQTRAVADAEQRTAAIERAMSENELQKMLIEDLQAAAKLFHRDGLPIYYMRLRFGSIVELTSRFLSMLDSNFVVRAHAERAVCFQFSRVDSPQEVWFDQEKLSGGQRVRLTTAFLMAIQKLVIPDVGLLVLDEPSMHLDPEGVDSLREMLLAVGRMLEGSEAQVLVCDHNESIVSSLPKRTRLTGKIEAIAPPAAFAAAAAPAPAT